VEAERILITGCGRSGTGFTSALLKALDLECGHERVFSLHAVARGEVDWPESLPAESSWLAAPFLADLPAGTAILHQVRNPLSVVRSLARIRLFEDPGPYRDFAEQHMAENGAFDDVAPLVACLRYWDEWNALVEREALGSDLFYRRYRVDELQPDYVAALLDELGQHRFVHEIEDRMRLVRSDSNTRGDKSLDGELTWESLPECAAKQAVLARASEYGFDLE
jgi:hypothetical protein